MQTTAVDTTKCPSHGPFCVDCRHCADFGLDTGRICLLPATTTTDPVTGGQAWLICKFARSADNAHCGPMGLAFKPRAARAPQQTPPPKSWWSSIRNVFFPFARAVKPINLADEPGVQVVQAPVNLKALTSAPLAVQRGALRPARVAIGRDHFVNKLRVAVQAKELQCARKA